MRTETKNYHWGRDREELHPYTYPVCDTVAEAVETFGEARLLEYINCQLRFNAQVMARILERRDQ